MDEATYRAWWPLHLRTAKGEVLSAEEQAIYAEGKRRLHEEEDFESSLNRLRQTRQEIKALEADRERILAERRQLRERVQVLEAALSESEKQAIGVGD